MSMGRKTMFSLNYKDGKQTVEDLQITDHGDNGSRGGTGSVADKGHKCDLTALEKSGITSELTKVSAAIRLLWILEDEGAYLLPQLKPNKKLVAYSKATSLREWTSI
ncbi:Hypothetical predicted protein [Octopus vulgaris]|uniref:Uncharacterized protein n=1 Tax=Octopus vulgaris TaxID=6645 RepID=A0AA36FCU8_OCTVU|nr:Hypothetical predicted protein [Octopus vulgaris]